MLGYDKVGSGKLGVIVLNDWICDTSTWDGARAYLDLASFTWVFADLRGYGRSISQRGQYTVTEAAGDVVASADSLGWQRFAIVGHSMSSLVALHVAQNLPDRIDRAVVLTPPPPGGFGMDQATVDAMRAGASGDEVRRTRMLKAMLGDRLSENWLRFKVARWREASDPEAVAGYVAMFAKDGLPNPTARIAVPMLAVTGEKDAEVMRQESVTKLLAPLCEKLVVTPLADCGHYPMQEAPPLLVGILERFLTPSLSVRQ